MWAEKIRDHWEGMCRIMGQDVEGGGGRQTLIRFGVYNIWNRRNGGLESVLRGMEQTNADVGMLQEEKLTAGIYTWGSSEYRVITTRAPSRQCGGVGLFYQDSPTFAVKALHQFGVNIIAFHLAMG